MRILPAIGLCLLLIPAFSQDPAALSRQLSSEGRTDRDKVTAIFRWICDNISYTVFQAKPVSSSWEVPEEEGPLKPLEERVAIAVLKRRTAFCDGYARLFKTLCDYAGIRAVIIQGYAKNYRSQQGRFGVNHFWNAVYFENEWHLLDATWAAGYVSWRGDAFVKDYDPAYFLSRPETFILDHYPDDPRWTLLDDAKTPEEFRQSPFKQRCYGKYHFISFFPRNGIIEANMGDTIELRLEADPARQPVSPDYAIDSSIFAYSSTWVFLHPENADRGTACRYRYPVTDEGVQWLYLLYNNDIVLRYRLHVKTRRS